MNEIITFVKSILMNFVVIDLTEKKLHLKSWLGCGFRLLSKPSLSGDKFFREEGQEPIGLELRDYSEVMYRFFTLFGLPIWPLGCYRIITLHRQEQSFEILVYKQVAGEEKLIGKEVATIYIHYWSPLALAILWLYYVYQQNK